MTLKLFFTLIAFVINTTAFAEARSEINTGRYLDSIKTNHQQLTAFLKDMPKGGDLHIHPSGATYAENMIRYVADDHLCINSQTYVVYEDSHCDAQNLLENAIKKEDFYNKVIDAWSMRNFKGNSESGHDHFFAAFSKYSVIVKKHRKEVLAEIAERAGLQNESYLELMSLADDNESGLLGKQLGWNPDFGKMREKLQAHDFVKITQKISKSIDQDEAGIKATLACDTEHAKAGCQVIVRYLYQVLREQEPEMVFAQLLAGFQAANQDKRVVGLNLVQPEDGPISMRDYKLQMQMIGYFHALYPKVFVTLHAGELDSSLVPSDGLKFHIHDAVTVAKANRIGHGFDIAGEDDAEALLHKMAKDAILVEINLSSNFSILNGGGEPHPLPLYMQFAVPLALSTDNEGISRSNLTNEYRLAVEKFQLNYTTLKTFARNSLTYSFLPGLALWSDPNYQESVAECHNDVLGSRSPSTRCSAFLLANEKAKLQWDLERRFVQFETKLSSR